jgi:hypothetical protein
MYESVFSNALMILLGLATLMFSVYIILYIHFIKELSTKHRELLAQIETEKKQLSTIAIKIDENYGQALGHVRELNQKITEIEDVTQLVIYSLIEIIDIYKYRVEQNLVKDPMRDVIVEQLKTTKKILYRQNNLQLLCSRSRKLIIQALYWFAEPGNGSPNDVSVIEEVSKKMCKDDPEIVDLCDRTIKFIRLNAVR